MRRVEDTDSPEIAMAMTAYFPFAKTRARTGQPLEVASLARCDDRSAKAKGFANLAPWTHKFSATLVLVSAEIYFSDAEIMQTRIDNLS
jgi:hypothetical protein